MMSPADQVHITRGNDQQHHVVVGYVADGRETTQFYAALLVPDDHERGDILRQLQNYVEQQFTHHICVYYAENQAVCYRG